MFSVIEIHLSLSLTIFTERNITNSAFEDSQMHAYEENLFKKQ